MAHVYGFSGLETIEINTVSYDFNRVSTMLVPYLIEVSKDNFDMIDKYIIIDFYQKLKNSLKQINSIFYKRTGNLIKIYVFINRDNIQTRRKVIDENLKIWDNLDKYLFEFHIHPKKYIKSFDLSNLEQIL